MDESPDQETTLAASEKFDNRRKTLSDALTVLNERGVDWRAPERQWRPAVAG